MLSKLTEREKEILNYIIKGFTNKQIGETLHLSSHTIKIYVENILYKFNVKNRLQAAIIGIKSLHGIEELNEFNKQVENIV